MGVIFAPQLFACGWDQNNILLCSAVPHVSQPVTKRKKVLDIIKIDITQSTQQGSYQYVHMYYWILKEFNFFKYISDIKS